MGENKKVMKKVLSMILAVLTVSVLLAAAVSAAHYKTIPGNTLVGGDFNKQTLDNGLNVNEYFWFGRSAEVSADNGLPYRGSTIVWQKNGGVGNSGCLKMSGTDNTASKPAICYAATEAAGLEHPCPYVESGKTYIAMIDVYRPEGVTTVFQFQPENEFGTTPAETTETGKWERLVIKFTSGRTDNFFIRLLALDNSFKPDRYILIDNFYLAEYNEKIDYMEMENDPTPPTGDGAVVISAVCAAAALAGVCVIAGKKKSR